MTSVLNTSVYTSQSIDAPSLDSAARLTQVHRTASDISSSVATGRRLTWAACSLSLLMLTSVSGASAAFFDASSSGASSDVIEQSPDGRWSVPSLRARLKELGARPDDWDGQGGVAPPPEALADAHVFIDVISALRVANAPVIYAPGDGEILFQWRVRGGFIEVAFAGDELVSWSARAARTAAIFGDDAYDRRQGTLPNALVEALLRV